MPVATSHMGQALSKVPEITIYFWVIKVLCTTVGETASDFLNVNLNLGLRGTSIITGVILAFILAVQFRTKKYNPIVYWLTVVFISVFGTLVTDNLTDGLHLPLELSTILFSILLTITFGVWYAKQKTLSIHSIFTRQREMFYWLAILFTFALGTAAGDLMAERLGLGYGPTGLIIAAVIVMFAIAWRMGLNAIIAFWFIYIMTRPLGASLGDYLTQSKVHGGLGLGATVTSLMFVVAIIVTVIYLALTKKDATSAAVIQEELREEEKPKSTNALIQLIVVLVILLSASVGGYYWQQRSLSQQDQSRSATISTESSSKTPTGSTTSTLGDLSTFKTIAQNMLNFVNAGNMSSAKSRANDLEYEWDTAEARLKPKDPTQWTDIDGTIDKVLRDARAVNPSQQDSKTALETLLAKLNKQ